VSLRNDIQVALDAHSAENGCDTPDFILAEFLTDCLAAFDRAVQAREMWYDRPCGDGAAILGKAPDDLERVKP
jgi:hypothetical protein